MDYNFFLHGLLSFLEYSFVQHFYDTRLSFTKCHIISQNKKYDANLSVAIYSCYVQFIITIDKSIYNKADKRIFGVHMKKNYFSQEPNRHNNNNNKNKNKKSLTDVYNDIYLFIKRHYENKCTSVLNYTSLYDNKGIYSFFFTSFLI